MSWIVEQSDESSSVNVNGNTLTCFKEGYYGSPINILYKDPAEKSGTYFWEINIDNCDEQGGNSPSVGLTTDQGFKDGWALRAMKYLGNLSDGSSLLVSQFGDTIKSGDKVGLLLKLEEQDLKFYIIHNDRPLGLAFHIKSPYPTPLYPVVSFNSNGQIRINRSSSIPSSIERLSKSYNGIQGHWNIVQSNSNNDLIGIEFEIHPNDQTENNYRVHTRVVNGMNFTIDYNRSTGQCQTSAVMSTMMMGPDDLMRKESSLNQFISQLAKLNLEGNYLVATTQNGQLVRFQRFQPAPPETVTNNIFS